MVYDSPQFEIISPDIVTEMRGLPEFLDDAVAKASLAKFLRYNLGFAWELLTEEQLFPFQEFIINGWFKKDYSLYMAARALGKSYLIAIFCLLYGIFYPNSKIVIVSSNFRRSKDIFSKMEKFLNHKGQNLLASNFILPPSKQNDKYLLKCINGSEIAGLPLGTGENLRGERANVLIIDEGLLVSEGIQRTVLEPFILANLDLSEQLKLKDLEQELIKEGVMAEEDKTKFQRNKIIICSSAPFEFEFLNEGILVPYIEKINKSNGDKNEPSYFVCRSSYHIGLKHGIIEEIQIKKLGADEVGAESDPILGRELFAKPVSGSGGYFNMRAVKECVVKDGEYPTMMLHRKNNKQEFLLSIDTSSANGLDSDHFAMSLFLLMPEDRRMCQVNTYARAGPGSDIPAQYEYLVYLLRNFNIIFIIIDGTSTDAQFLKDFNESQIAKENNIKLGFLDVDFEVGSEGYVQELKKAREQWSLEGKRIVYKFIASSSSNRRMAEILQAQINARRVWFGSKISQNKEAFSLYSKFQMPYEFKDRKGRSYEGILEFLTDQDDYCRFVIDELALIQVKISNSGSQSFELPDYCKRTEDPDRPRKDHFSTLAMGTYAMKVIWDLYDLESSPAPTAFVPFFV